MFLTFFYVGLECERGVLYKTHLFVAVGSLARYFSDSAAYLATAPCISRDSDLAQCSYQSNQLNQNLSWQHAMLVFLILCLLNSIFYSTVL